MTALYVHMMQSWSGYSEQRPTKKLRSTMSSIPVYPNALMRQLLDLGRVKDLLGREAGKVSQLHECMGIERVLDMNSWLAEYDLSVDI